MDSAPQTPATSALGAGDGGVIHGDASTSTAGAVQPIRPTPRYPRVQPIPAEDIAARMRNEAAAAATAAVALTCMGQRQHFALAPSELPSVKKLRSLGQLRGMVPRLPPPIGHAQQQPEETHARHDQLRMPPEDPQRLRSERIAVTRQMQQILRMRQAQASTPQQLQVQQILNQSVSQSISQIAQLQVQQFLSDAVGQPAPLPSSSGPTQSLRAQPPVVAQTTKVLKPKPTRKRQRDVWQPCHYVPSIRPGWPFYDK
jgi:hypothetical protein